MRFTPRTAAASAAVAAALLAGPGPASAADALQLSSTDVADGATIGNDYVFKGFGCTGKNLSPALAWSGAPAGTKSFALTVYDPDAPTGSGWWHWVVYDLPATSTGLSRGAGAAKGGHMPKGSVQGRTDFGAPGYGGPCPPPGDKPHHYVFTLYALDLAKLPVPAGASAALIGFNLHFHTVAKASFTALYGR